jgi:DNA invertase Pin-like site-specific DNA recombinase
MKPADNRVVRCAIYTRVSTDSGLDQEFNSLDAQYDASQAYIRSQAHAGWTLVKARYDDGGFSGGSTDRPALKRLLADVVAHRIHIIVVYKVDRLTRSLVDFAKLVELFDAHGVSFVSVTQQFNTTTSMGRLTLNVLLSFAQFEREVTSERIPRASSSCPGRSHQGPRGRFCCRRIRQSIALGPRRPNAGRLSSDRSAAAGFGFRRSSTAARRSKALPPANIAAPDISI